MKVRRWLGAGEALREPIESRRHAAHDAGMAHAMKAGRWLSAGEALREPRELVARSAWPA